MSTLCDAVFTWAAVSFSLSLSLSLSFSLSLSLSLSHATPPTRLLLLNKSHRCCRACERDEGWDVPVREGEFRCEIVHTLS